MIAIIDYDAGNLKSVEKALRFLGEELVISRDRKEILAADGVILPGVGAFGEAMQKLREFHLDDAVYEVVEQKIPFLGICLGLQLLFERSEECPNVSGLGVLNGEIQRIPNTNETKVPHIGWNSLKLSKDGALFQGITGDPYVYFVHSYYLKAQDLSIVKAVTEYGVSIHASVEKDFIYACQFHPEKSGDIGLKILNNFASICRDKKGAQRQ